MFISPFSSYIKSLIPLFDLQLFNHIYFNSFIYQFFYTLRHGAHEGAIFMLKSKEKEQAAQASLWSAVPDALLISFSIVALG